MSEMLEKTPLFDRHVHLDAHLGQFAGYRMPIHYSSVKEEVLAVRERAGLFDISHMDQHLVAAIGM